VCGREIWVPPSKRVDIIERSRGGSTDAVARLISNSSDFLLSVVMIDRERPRILNTPDVCNKRLSTYAKEM